MRRKLLIIASAAIVSSLLFLSTASAYWVWTPETKKFINPKYAVKDSPKEQFDWAMTFYDARDYERAAFEFDKLTRNYEYSEYAAKAQYHVGLCYESEGKYYLAFQNYQKAVDNFPHIDNIDEISAREFNIGHIFAQKENPKVLGTDIMTSFDRAIEIYKKVVENAPFGKIADQAQFKLGETMKTAGRYDEATVVFQKFVEDYPNSPLAEKARYEVANCAYRASLQPAYDAAPTDKAIKAFEEFTEANKDTQLSKEADQTLLRLKDKAAEKSMMTAEFYERTKHYDSAAVYYKDVLERFPDSTIAPIAKKRIEEIQARKVPAERKNWLAWPGSGKKQEKKVEGAQAQKEGQAQPAPAKKEKSKGWFPWFGKGEKEKKAAGEVAQPAEVPAQALSGVAEEVPQPAPMPITVEEKKEVAAPPAPAVTASEPPPAPVAEKIEEPAPAVPQRAQAGPTSVKVYFEEKPAEKLVPRPVEPPRDVVKTGWQPFTFEKKAAVKETVKETKKIKETKEAKGRDSGWFPFKFDKKDKGPKEPAPVKPAAQPKKDIGKPARKGWLPFAFGGKEEGQKGEPKSAQEPVKKGWKPLNFEKKGTSGEGGGKNE